MDSGPLDALDLTRLRQAVDASGEVIFMTDSQGIFTFVNPQFEKLYGYSASEVVGRVTPRVLKGGDVPSEDYTELWRRLLQGETLEQEFVNRTKDGRLLNIEATVNPIRDEAHGIVGFLSIQRDVTARKRAEEELRFQQTVLTTERELTLDGILVVDQHSRVLSFNKRFAQMWGIQGEILGTRADIVLLQSVMHKLPDPERFMDGVRRLYDRHDEVSQDEVTLTDGRIFDRYSAPLRGPEGRYYGRVWNFRDVTERRQAEAALRQERDRARRYLDVADVILLALDLEGRIVLVNRYACSLLGWTEDELLGRDWIETCLPARIREVFRLKFRDLVGGDLTVVENPILTRSGEERLIEWRNTVLRDDTGRLNGTFSSGTDITERHRAVEALRTTEERMRFALENAGVGIWDMDYTTGILRWSETLEAQYGLQPGTFGGTFDAFVERMHPDDRNAVLNTIQEAMKLGTDFSFENRAVWPDGTERWLSGGGRIHLGEHGEPVRGVGISMDVTERRTLEAQYRQAQKMEAVGRLAGGVAHDFNNVLTAILGYCDLLRADLGPDDPRQADLAEIQKAGMRAEGLTRQLLAFSRKQIIQPRVLDLNGVVADMQAMLDRLIGEDVKVVLDLRKDPALVMVDRGQAEQIVMNLAVNARDAMPGGGVLTIETAAVELDEDFSAMYPYVKPGPYVVLTVTDSGTGMTPEVQARLFEPFFTTKELGKGTGLGLATVYGIVKQSGGSINVYSEIGTGSSFKVYFPRADVADRAVDAPPAGARPPAGGQTVCVVEDEEGLRGLARRLLERQGYTVLVAANADEALQVFEQHPSIDVLLTDVVMPGSSGPELTRRLVERRPSLKVVYMSGYTDEAIVHHGVLDPGIAFLHKPFTAEALGRKIREVLDR